VLAKTLGVPLFQEQVMKLAMVAADYTPGEADQLRRDMAAWRRSGRIERHRERLIERMSAKGIAVEFAERVFEQIRGFGEYGFPESHAASFALISYATAYLRCHYPAEFCCGLLNAQPMGFYTPATIVEEAKRLGVEVRPIDVTRSDWACTLEPTLGVGGELVSKKDSMRGRAGPPSPPSRLRRDHRLRSEFQADGVPYAVRMGLRFIKGISEADFERIDAARATRPFATLADFVERTRLSSNLLSRLAEAGAFESLSASAPEGSGSRRESLWEVRGLARGRHDELPLPSAEGSPRFRPLGSFDTIAWDYVAAGHSPRGHPLGPLREQLRRLGLPDARGVSAMRHDRRARYAGMVICRQRPSTASGVVFMTLEDETGFVNLVIWKDVFARHEVIAKTSAFLGVTGKIQSQDGVVHLIADELWVPDLDLAPRSAGSHDWC